ncbi:hypothetical protein EES44_24280 [Streptomyces sp. ADI96-15]|uniref:hypothetical protein n=1 Tax=Streptomyces TaxID=1883 RepID=UPI000F557B62|nr:MULTISPECIES: hypothetical protein [Streptomyces]MDH6189123.1 hypothetical protein [Streptomyces sp. CZ24]RPK58366.1 hypothetical protein EES44_24280 [Streptomyces sp. ADI96-15]RWZ77864.1 hypothetical protein EQK42_00615 [Streptomyces albidoflavus]
MTTTPEVDIVVPVRVGAANQQLRYALRSWTANIPHRHVWVVGYKPSWLRGVRHIPTRQSGTKYQNTTEAVRLACLNRQVSDVFLLCNDDFFVMQPQTAGVPALHRGPVSRVEAYYASRVQRPGRYLRGLRQTRDLLVSLGHDNPMSYELHVPLPVQKEGMLKTLDVCRRLDVVHKRTAYGVLNGIGGDQIRDVKVLNRSPRFDREGPFLSTMPDSFTHGHVGQYIRRAFPRACSYEAGGR